jgi:hypothetical protein
MRPDLVFARRIAGSVALLLLLVGGYAGNAEAQTWHSCTTTTQADCTKEIRIYNNAGQRTLYVVWQGSIQLQPAIGCAQGDSWLQNAFNDVANCYTVNNTYLAYVNPVSGIKPGEFASIQIPWWSKTTDGGVDKAVDWWRASRIYIFDDQTALNESYLNSDKTPAPLAAPVISCTTGGIANNKCVPNELQIYRVKPGSSAGVADHTPMQLNEFTFGDIPNTGLKNCNAPPPDPNCSLNVNFNVSYVDHVYLPIAIGPIRTAKDTGYMGTTMPRGDFQRALKTFAGCDTVALHCNNPTKWPVFNNPLVQGQPKYPLAGVKLPSTLAAFNYYMSPGVDTHQNPILLPSSNDPGSWPTPVPTTLQQTATNWSICTGNAPPSVCPQSFLYDAIEDAFNLNYQSYLNTCPADKRPAFLQPKPNSNPARPINQFAFWRNVHGWVEFESLGCPIVTQGRVKLPVSSLPPSPPQPKGQAGSAPINYIALQYNWNQDPAPAPRLWFNAYTRFIHGTPAQGGVQANAYAFSIDDAASVMNIGASGLIVAVGGPNGLENTSQFPPPLPPWYQWYMFNIGLGGGGQGWKSYSFCGEPTQQFQLPFQSPDSPPGFGFNPALHKFPCTIVLTGNNNKQYKFTIQKAGIPQKAIWPKFTQPQGFDPTVISCPEPGDNWCQFINEVANPGTDNPQTIPTYTISTRGPT